MAEKVVLAYSGGLDTSVILKWLKDQGYEIIAYMADLGQQDDYTEEKERAISIGASKVYVEDLKREFITDFIFPAIRANAVYEGKYLLGTSLARPLIAKRHAEIARAEGTNIVAHGATGKGNDQVRFELAFYTLMRDVKIIAPWRDEKFLSVFQGRKDLIAYAKEKNIPVPVSVEKPYSNDENIMHLSFEAGILENPGKEPPESTYKNILNPIHASDSPEELIITFRKGTPVKLENKTEGVVKEDPIKMFSYLNTVAGRNGIGRVDMVENRFVGMKSRGVYETPAGTVLMAAHLDLEGLTMDREVKLLRDSLIPKFAQLIYCGFWYSPEMEVLSSLMDKAQEYVSGNVFLKLYKGNILIQGRESDDSLYNTDAASMDIHGGYDQRDASGFIKLNGLRLRSSSGRILKKLGWE